VLEAVRRHEEGDSRLLDGLSRLLEEQDAAKQVLRRKGYGWTGLGIEATAEEVGDAQ